MPPDAGVAVFSPGGEAAAATKATLPVTVSVSPTTDLRPGQPVTVRIVADGGSQVFGAEARLCAGDAVVAYDADIRPTQTGKCVLHPLGEGTDAFVEAVGTPPYQSLDLNFRAGVGTDRYTRQDGSPVQITCDAGHPCQIVLKVQVPGGFGFKSYPVSFA